jgi:TolA-binding protein
MVTSFCRRACLLLAVSMGGFAAAMGLLTIADSQSAPLAERKEEPERLENRKQERREAKEQELERLQARVQELEHLEARLQALERLVAERETVIEELSKQLSVSVREERFPRPAPPKPDPPTPWAGSPAVAAVPAGPARDVSSVSEPPTSAPREPPIEGQGETAVASPPQAPGQVEVDVDAAELERALDRTLVQTGVLLLPFGQAELAPSLEFTRREADAPVVIVQNGRSFVGQTRLRRDELTSTLGLRLGLPYDAQLELDLPFRYVDQSEVTRIGFAARTKTSLSGFGVGDFGIGVAKTLLRERKWWPDIVARINWDTATGERRAGDVVLGGNGFNEITGSLSAFKRQDPLAFLARLSYETAFEKDDERPGDEWVVGIGAVLAASPETSLRFIFDQTFLSESEFEGQEIEGSDARSGVLTLGASSILWRGIFLDVAVGVGLTDDAADYSVIVSLPIRFSLPFPR